MHLTLSATGLDSKLPLFQVKVDDQGQWSYESRAVEQAEGKLMDGDVAQLRSLYDSVPWDQEVLNNPISADDRTLLQLEVNRENSDKRLYQFSEAMNHLSWQFRDLVHFLRHNVANHGDPVGREGQDAKQTEPPAVH
jgi:hypothetical protein